MSTERIDRKRTLADKFISKSRETYYSLYEPIALALQRRIHDKEYQNKNSEPLISVYIPTYNRADLLKERGIPTVLDQDYKNFELIIIGDCCTDNTEEVVSSFNDSRIKFYNIPYRKKRYPNIVELHWLAGPVIAANEALTRVQGTWIARLDDDDLWSKDHLSSLLNFAQNGDFEFVSAQSTSIRYGEESIVHGVGALDPYYTQKDAPPGVPNPKIGATQTWLYRSYLKLFRYNIDCWRKSWNKVNDLDIGYRIYLAGARIGYLEKVVASIIPRPGEQTVGIDAYKQDSSSKLEHYKF